MKAWATLLIASLTLINCNESKQKVNNSNSNANKSALPKDFSGIYLNTKKNSLSFKLIKLADSDYYFELLDNDKSNPMFDKRQVLGNLRLISDTFKIINSTAILNSFISIIKKDTVIIDSTELKMYDDFKDIAGIYLKENNDSLITANYELFIGSKWDEGQFIRNAKFAVYSYPSIHSSSKEISVEKNNWASTYIDVYNKDSLRLDFAYIKLKTGLNTLSGWMSVKDYYTILKRVYQCEKDENGTQKWNKSKRYTLYYNTDGKFIKKELD